MNSENLELPNFWKYLIIFLVLLACILILMKCLDWLKDHIGPKVTTVARLIDKHENSAPIHQGGIRDNGRMEFKVNSSMYAAHEIDEKGKIIYQGKRLLYFIC